MKSGSSCATVLSETLSPTFLALPTCLCGCILLLSTRRVTSEDDCWGQPLGIPIAIVAMARATSRPMGFGRSLVAASPCHEGRDQFQPPFASCPFAGRDHVSPCQQDDVLRCASGASQQAPRGSRLPFSRGRCGDLFASAMPNLHSMTKHFDGRTLVVKFLQ